MEQQQQAATGATDATPATPASPIVLNESPVAGSAKPDRRMSDEWGQFLLVHADTILIRC